MPDIFGSKHHEFRPGMGYRQLLDSDYQNKVMHAVEKVENSWAGFEGLYPVDYQLRQGAIIVRIIGRESLSDGTFRYLFQKIEPQNLDFTGNTSGPLTRDSSNIDSDLQGIYAYNLGNCQDVPIDGSVVVEVHPGQAGDYYTFKYDIQDTTIGQVLSVAANGSISWVEIEQSSSGTYQNRTFGLSGNETVNWATALDSNLTVQAGDRGIFRRGHCEGGVRVVVTGTVAGDSASASHCSQEIYVENAVDGTFKLRVEGVDSGAIAWNSTTQLGTEINTTLGGNASVSISGNGTHASPWNVTFSDYVARSPMEADIRGLKSTQLWTYIPATNPSKYLQVDHILRVDSIIGANITANTITANSAFTMDSAYNVSYPCDVLLIGDGAPGIEGVSNATAVQGVWRATNETILTKTSKWAASKSPGAVIGVSNVTWTFSGWAGSTWTTIDENESGYSNTTLRSFVNSGKVHARPNRRLNIDTYARCKDIRIPDVMPGHVYSGFIESYNSPQNNSFGVGMFNGTWCLSQDGNYRNISFANGTYNVGPENDTFEAGTYAGAMHVFTYTGINGTATMNGVTDCNGAIWIRDASNTTFIPVGFGKNFELYTPANGSYWVTMQGGGGVFAPVTKSSALDMIAAWANNMSSGSVLLYSPYQPAHWTFPPSDVASALDAIAAWANGTVAALAAANITIPNL